MNHRQLKKLIKSVNTHVQADQKWKSQQREVLLHAMKAQTTSLKTEGLGRKMALNFGAMVARPVGVMAMILTVVFGSVIASVSAATNSTPGQILYPLKLTTERIHVSFVSDKKEKANLQISFAKKRLQEIKDVVKNEPDQIKAQEKIKKPIANLKTTIASVKIAVEDVKKEDNNNAIDIVSDLKDVANIAAEVVAEPAVAKAVAETEAADKKIVDEKAIAADADMANADGSDKTVADKEKAIAKDTSVGAEIKKLIEETVTSTKDAQASVIRELALKEDKTKAKDEILKYVELLKKEREVKMPVNVEKVEVIEPTQPEVSTTPVGETIAPTLDVKADTVVATKTETLKAESAIAEAEKVVDTKAVDDLKKFDEMIKKVIELLAKDDVLGAMKALGIDVEPTQIISNADTTVKTEEVKPVEPKTEEVTTSSTSTITNTNTTKQ